MQAQPNKPPTIFGWTEPIICPGCHEGYIVDRRGPYGRFYGCSRFPQCKTKLQHWEIGELLDPDFDAPYYGM